MNATTTLEIIRAAQANTVLGAALVYQRLGFSVLPLQGKRPSCSDWKQYQQRSANVQAINSWHAAGKLNNVGLVCGAVSGNIAVLDLDGAAGYPAFVATFPHLAETYTVATGGGVGKHIYWRVDEIPDSVKAMATPIGNLEMCAEGRQIVAPPSIHPTTKNLYIVERPLDILHVADLKEVVEWIESFKAKAHTNQWQPPQNHPTTTGDLNPRLLEEIGLYFAGRGYRQYGDWLHGQCVYPSRHTHGDRNPSFGFNTQTGYGSCFRCGTILAKDICERIGIRPDDFGGLLLAAPKYQPPNGSTISTSDAAPPDSPSDSADKIKSPEPQVERDGQPPVEVKPPAIDDVKLPNWLQMYLDWAGTTGNQTPMSFHLAAGLWLLSVAVGRRLYGDAPWGIKIYPNLYLMLIASTTYYRKSTAYKLAEQIARTSIPHMLMPTPGSPERFQEALSGQVPANFDKLSRTHQERLTKAQPFAAQRGLLKDEVAGLFSAMNRKDYLSGMKDLLMELYDCPDYSDKDTQAGLTIVENAALSILGVTTPDGLNGGITYADWANGLLIRFALITPEADYAERPALAASAAPPYALIDGLRKLHEKLPMPQNSEEGMQSPGKLALKVECWEEVQTYSEGLRRLCNPERENELDERLKGVYGRMHVQAFKLASLFAALDWMDADTEAPTVTLENWQAGKAIAELWLTSAHRLLERLDHKGEAQREQSLQRRLLDAFLRAGSDGEKLYVIYKNLHIPAREARQTAEELVKAGMLSPVRVGRSEGYVHKDFVA
jgi:hypothetical protein